MKLRRHLRLAFHDWMWDNGRTPLDSWLRRQCWRLPTYFTDPHMDGIPKDPEKFDAWFESLEPVEVVGSPTMLFDHITGTVTPMPQTYSTGTATTWRWS